MKNVSSTMLAILAVLCLVALPATASTGGSGLAEVAGGPSGISFILGSGNYDGVTISINGPGDLNLRQAFAPGTVPVFSLFDEAGHTLPDGTYGYELRAQPRLNAAERAALEAARTAGDDAAAARLQLPDATSLVQSGYFSIVGGSVVIPDPSIVEKSPFDTDDGSVPIKAQLDIPTKDQVFLDDLIVEGSICGGLDCTNGENFGFDTLRLKENNLRIRFFDTSASASFPSNDWEITANDSSNGGANKFSITDIDGGRVPFTIEAGAPANSLFVEDGGRLGFGTTTPVANLHVVEGNTPTLRLEQDGSNGFTPQTWDVAGNEANFFIRDATNGSTLPVQIKPGAPSASIFIDAQGDVGIGTSSPGGSQQLDVVGGGMQVRVEDGSNASLFVTSNGGANPLSYILRTSQTASGIGGFTLTESGADSPFKILKGALDNSLVIRETAGTVRVGINEVNPAGTLDVVGTIFVNNGQVHPDYVFEPDFPLETIEEHAAFMWENKRLPAMKPAVYNANGQAKIELGASQNGMLEELEKAHIYIDQLNNNVNELTGTLKEKNEELAALKAMTTELAARLALLEAKQN